MKFAIKACEGHTVFDPVFGYDISAKITSPSNCQESPLSQRPVAIVTGGSRGIGRAIANQLAVDGYAVAVNYARNNQAAEEVVKAISESGGTAIAVSADIGKANDRSRLIGETIEQWGRLDVLVNNAGITSQGRLDILDATEESWDVVFDTNLKGPFFLSQLAAKKMIEFGPVGEGKHATSQQFLVNVSSISSYAISTNRADYCMTKAALGMMTKLFAARLAEANIGVFEVCPGVVASDMTAAVEEKYDRLIAEGLTPIRRWGQPDDVAKAVSAVVGGYFPFSTGECINVDGGFHLRRL